MHTDIVLAFFIVVWHIICSKQVVKRHFNDCKTIKKIDPWCLVLQRANAQR